MDFVPDIGLLTQAAAGLAGAEVYWLIGGSGSGKTTVCRELAGRTGWPVYDMDEQVFGRWQERYTRERHPATTAWFRAENPLAFILSLSWNAFSDLYRAANIEHLALMAEDETRPAGPLLVDGGITHATVLAQVVPVARIACLAVDPALSGRMWDEAPERAEMKEAILALPDGPAASLKFLEFDRKISRQLVDHSKIAGIRVFEWGAAGAAGLADELEDYFGW